ncbi:hypothetical protein NXC24_PC01567 (plasmid) [Rhizobium sp. NXC24]|nr:hypothetical protein NXC24_PC01567 [Rhizobium sp. NXC24]
MDPGGRTGSKPGVRCRALEWTHSPESCRYASGMMVLPNAAATVCEFEPATETCRVMRSGSDVGCDINRKDANYEPVIDLDGEILM